MVITNLSRGSSWTCWTSDPAQSRPQPMIMLLSSSSTGGQLIDSRVRDLAYLFRLFISCAEPASKENRIRPVSGEGLCIGASKFPVLLFLGMRSERSGDDIAGDTATSGVRVVGLNPSSRVSV